MKEIEEDSSEWREKLYSWTGRILLKGPYYPYYAM